MLYPLLNEMEWHEMDGKMDGKWICFAFAFIVSSSWFGSVHLLVSCVFFSSLAYEIACTDGLCIIFMYNVHTYVILLKLDHAHIFYFFFIQT